MVEVYSTDVNSKQEEEFLLQVLHTKFPDYKINFDLEDRDNILRAETDNALLDVEGVVKVMKDFGFIAEVLPDEPNVHNNIGNLKEKSTDAHKQMEVIVNVSGKLKKHCSLNNTVVPENGIYRKQIL